MNRTLALSFPKSGRTWVELMAAKAQSLRSGLPVQAFLAGNLDPNRIRAAGLPILEFGHAKEKRRITGVADFPRDAYADQRVALLVRDPRDVLVSRYYYERFQHARFHDTLEDFVRYEATDDPEAAARWGLKPILNWMNAWAANRDSLQDFLLLTYEGFHEDTPASLKALLRFAGIHVDPATLAAAVEYAGFDNMRALEESNELNWQGLPNAPTTNGKKTRRGVVGAHRTELSEELARWLDDRIQRALDPFYAQYRAA